MKKVTILQPTYLPWVGYFEMIAATDVFIIYDHVQFVRKSWQHRNNIKSANGVLTLSVPVKHGDQATRICDAELSLEKENFLEKHWKSISTSYRKAKYFKQYESVFADIYSRQFTHLSGLNTELIKSICELLHIEKQFILSSTLGVENLKVDKNQDVIEICKSVGANFIYDAKGAEAFLQSEVFRANGVEIQFQDYIHPTYSQLWGPFVSHMSVLDVLFNEGESALEIILSGRVSAAN